MNKLKVKFMMLVCEAIWIYFSKNNESDLSNRAWALCCDLQTELDAE